MEEGGGGRGVAGMGVEGGDRESRAEEKMEESSAGRVDYQRGFCKDERRARVCFYGIRWSALILSPHVRSRHDPPSRPYICIRPLNSRAPCKTAPRRGGARGGERGRGGEWREGGRAISVRLFE